MVDRRRIELSKLLDYMETHDKSEGKSPKTLEWHRRSVECLISFLREQGKPTDLRSVGTDQVREFIVWQQSKTWRGHKLSTFSINTRVRALRFFFHWLQKEGYTKTHLLENVRPPKLPQVLVQTLSDDEVVGLFAVINVQTMSGARDAAILALLLDTGLRVSELTGLAVLDVHLDEQFVRVIGKGNKERMVAFGSSTKKALVRYLIHFRGEPASPGIDAFFLTLDGFAITNEGVKSSLRRIGEAAGLDRRLHPHLCRHTYATNFLLNGGNVIMLKQNLGHTTLSMVDHYVHIVTSRAALASKDFSPLDRLNLSGLRRVGTAKEPDKLRAFQRRLVKLPSKPK